MDTGAFASRSSLPGERHTAVARAAHEGGVNVTVHLSLPVHLPLNGLALSATAFACEQLLAIEESDLGAETRR